MFEHHPSAGKPVPAPARPFLRPLVFAMRLLVTGSLLGAAWMPSAQAQNQAGAVQSYRIPAGELTSTLNRFAEQAGVFLSAPASLTQGKASQGLSGSYTVEQGFERLLKAHGLQALRRADGSYGLRATGSAAAAAVPASPMLPAVLITGAREGGQSPSLLIGRQDIERRNPADLQDLFGGQAAIQVGSSLPISQKLYVNGIEENNLATSIDGSRQNNKIFHHNATTLIDPALLKAVRVDAGVAPADAGPGALAGAVAYETLDASELLAPGQSLGGLLKGEFDSNGDTSTLSGALFGKQGGIEYLGYVKRASGDVREDGAGEAIVGSGTGLLSGLAKLAYQSASGHRVELSHESVKDDEARPYRADMGRILGGRPTALTRNYELHRQNTALSYSSTAPTGWWDPRFQLARSVTDLRIPEAKQVTQGSTESLNGKLENRFRLRQGSVVAGIDAFSDQADTDYRSLSNAAYNEQGVEKLRNVGVYAQARMNFGGHVRASFGARYDEQRFTGVDGTRDSLSGSSYNLSGEFDVARGWTLSAGYADVWAGVPLAENFIINPSWRYPATIGPVTSDNAFVGLRARFDGVLAGWSIDGRVFRTNIRDARTPDYRGGPNLRKDVASEGFELGGGYAWSSGFARLRYADIDTSIDGNPAESYTGRYLTTPIGRIVTIEAVHYLAERQWSVGANAQVVLRESDTYDEAIGGRALPLAGYETLDLFLQYQPARWRGLALRAEINNLFDRTYTSRATYGQEYRDVVPLREPGRGLRLMASYQF